MNINVGLRSRNSNFNVAGADVDLTGRASRFGAWTSAWIHDPLETDPAAAFAGITYLFEYKWPERFNAIHMSLIPKGPNRGKVVVWDNAPVIATLANDPLVAANTLWSLQAWAIVDPADEPAGARFQNFFFPVGPIEGDFGTPSTVRIPNLFCAGHTWTQNGDLAVFGGMTWDLDVNQYADNKVYIWAPSLPLSAYSTDDSGTPTFNSALTGGHYTTGKGAWVQAAVLDFGRYYPSVNLTPSLVRTGNKPVMIVAGGSNDLLLANQDYAHNPTWNTYEAYVVNAAPTATSSGLVKDVDGVDLWDGPGVSLDPFEDSLYFYMRSYFKTNGDLFMAGMVHRSATLPDHDGAPGVWTTTQGHDIGITGILDEFRYYGSSVQLQNFESHADVIYRMGGAQIPPFIDWTAGVDPDREFDTNTVERINLTAGGTEQWAPAPAMNVPRQMLNTVVLPDGSIVAFGGVDWQPTDEPPVPHEFLQHGGLHNDNFLYHTAVEVLFPGATKWVIASWTASQSRRDYHQTTILLPDGRVINGGGESRDHGGPLDGYDYEVWEPHYLRPQDDSPYRPTRPTTLAMTVVSGGAPASQDAEGCYLLSYATQYEITCDDLPQYRYLNQVNITATGSCTHHADLNSKIRFLVVTKPNATTIRFTTPADESAWQKGYHLLWVLTDQGVPAEALWFKL